MKAPLFLAIIILFSLKGYSQEDLVWKVILDEDFNSKNRNWQEENSIIRKAQISNGFLYDYFGEEGYVNANRIPVSFANNNDHQISFSIANKHGNADKKYRVYKKKNNGEYKESWQNNPVFGFIWGFKDWDNYNALLFLNQKESNGYSNVYSTSVKLYFKENGNETTLINWKDFEYQGKNPIPITIEQYDGTSVRIISGNSVLYQFTGGVFQWYGSYIGPYIGNGAKVALDYVVVKERKPHRNTNWNEYALKSKWKDKGSDHIEGIYENLIRTETHPKYKLGVLKTENGYDLIYLGGQKTLVGKWVILRAI